MKRCLLLFEVSNGAMLLSTCWSFHAACPHGKHSSNFHAILRLQLYCVPQDLIVIAIITECCVTLNILAVHAQCATMKMNTEKHWPLQLPTPAAVLRGRRPRGNGLEGSSICEMPHLCKSQFNAWTITRDLNPNCLASHRLLILNTSLNACTVIHPPTALKSPSSTMSGARLCFRPVSPLLSCSLLLAWKLAGLLAVGVKHSSSC